MADPAGLERECWQRWQGGNDEAARDRLLQLHLPYARTLAAMAYARRFNDEIEFDDYHQFARVGLLEAMNRYDPDRGAAFRTFAARRIQGAILNGLERYTERLQQISARQRLRDERLQEAREWADGQADGSHGSRTPAQLLDFVAEAGIGLALMWMLEGTGLVDDPDRTESIPFYRDTEVRQLRTRLLEVVEALPDRERRIVKSHYLQDVPLETVARELGVTKGRVSQIHKQALLRLRQSAKSLEAVA